MLFDASSTKRISLIKGGGVKLRMECIDRRRVDMGSLKYVITIDTSTSSLSDCRS